MSPSSIRTTLVRQSFRNVYSLFDEVEEREIRPPEGLLYVAAALERRGHQVTAIDNEVLNLVDDQLLARIASTEPNMVGMGATTPEFPHIAKFLERLRSELNVVTVLGGPHATADAEAVLANYPGIDYVIRGEGEITTSELADSMLNGEPPESLPGLAFHKNGRVIVTPPRSLISDLDALALPARHLLDYRQYHYPLRGRGMEQVATMITSRGCPYRCIFCYSMHGHQVRFRSIPNVIAELEQIIDKYGVRYFIFHDECFTLNRQRVLAFCNQILNRKLDIKWFCFTRGDTIDQEVADRMAEAGCVKISLGVESGSQDMLDRSGKKTKLDKITQAFRILNRAGIETRGSFIIGLPGEDQRSVQQTFDFAKSLKMYQFGLNIATPYPGTQMWKMAEAGNGIRFENTELTEFRRWGKAVIATEKLAADDLVRAQRRGMVQFYLRPKILWFYLREYLRGNHTPYYYRPVRFALKEWWSGLLARISRDRLP
jgi:anaerobic magnesium-protoporphyrin IX monomethyl ester cyclase